MENIKKMVRLIAASGSGSSLLRGWIQRRLEGSCASVFLQSVLQQKPGQQMGFLTKIMNWFNSFRFNFGEPPVLPNLNLPVAPCADMLFVPRYQRRWWRHGPLLHERFWKRSVLGHLFGFKPLGWGPSVFSSGWLPPWDGGARFITRAEFRGGTWPLRLHIENIGQREPCLWRGQHWPKIGYSNRQSPDLCPGSCTATSYEKTFEEEVELGPQSLRWTEIRIWVWCECRCKVASRCSDRSRWYLPRILYVTLVPQQQHGNSVFRVMVPYRAGSLKDWNSWFSFHAGLPQTGQWCGLPKQIYVEMPAQTAFASPHISMPPEGESGKVQHLDGWGLVTESEQNTALGGL